MKVTFIRHTSVGVEADICYGQSDVDVSATFEVEAQQLCAKLQHHTFDAVYCSPLSRCRKLSSFCGYPDPIVDNRLMELSFGDWEMKSWNEINDSQIERWYADWINEKPTNGESFAEQVQRVENFLNELKTIGHKQILIFTHAGVIRSVGIATNQFSLAEAFESKVEYGDILELSID
jgi:alpha-ribazole phosphatase